MTEQKIFFTSDQHYFHSNIINYCNRPFKNVDDMKEVLIDRHNSVVSKEDKVYYLGDFAMGSNKKSDELNEILHKLNGIKYLILGNHDTYITKEPCESHFVWIRHYYELTYKSKTWGKKTFCMMHYPLLTWRSSGKRDKNGYPRSINLHGHCHGNLDEGNKDSFRIDVGVDSHNYTPVSIDQIISIMNKRVDSAKQKT